jgi:hypothetical protein
VKDNMGSLVVLDTCGAIWQDSKFIYDRTTVCEGEYSNILTTNTSNETNPPTISFEGLRMVVPVGERKMSERELRLPTQCASQARQDHLRFCHC